MSLETSTIETEDIIENQEIMVGESDLRYIENVIEKIEKGKVEEKWSLNKYNVKQMEEMMADPNRHLTALDVGKKDNEVGDQELGMNFVKEDKYGFSLAFRYALRNEQFREDRTKEELLEKYEKMKREMEEGLKKYKQDKGE